VFADRTGNAKGSKSSLHDILNIFLFHGLGQLVNPFKGSTAGKGEGSMEEYRGG